MYGKQGINYVDWIMSMGLFLVAVIAIFAFLRPGIQPDYQSAHLTTLVEQGMLDNITWSVKKTPIFIYTLTDYYPDISTGNIEVSSIVLQEFSTNWSFTTYYPKSYNPTTYGDITVAKSANKITVNRLTSTCQTQDMPLYSVYSPQEVGNPTIRLKCTPDSALQAPNPEQYCNVSLGVTESIEGIKEQFLDRLKNDYTYTDLKILWQFPNQKEFQVIENNVVILGSTEDPKEVSVYARQLGTWYVNQTGSIIPTNITVRVW